MAKETKTLEATATYLAESNGQYVFLLDAGQDVAGMLSIDKSEIPPDEILIELNPMRRSR